MGMPAVSAVSDLEGPAKALDSKLQFYLLPRTAGDALPEAVTDNPTCQLQPIPVVMGHRWRQ